MAKLGDLACYALDRDGNAVWFLPGQEVPPWAAKQLGKHVFADGDDSAIDDGDADADGDEVAVPPQHGPGSGRAKWAAYAEAHDLDVDGLTKDEIIAALEEEGVAVE